VITKNNHRIHVDFPPRVRKGGVFFFGILALLIFPTLVPGQSLHERILADEAKDQANEIIRKERELRNMQQGPSDPGPGERPTRQPKGPSESKLKADQVNGIMDRARAASDRGDLPEALRLAREAWPIAQNGKFKASLEVWIRDLQAAIAHNERWQAADNLRLEANATFDRGDQRGALALYHRALATNPDCLNESGKKWVRDLEARLNAAGTMHQAIDRYANSLRPAPTSGELKFLTSDTPVVDTRAVPAGLPASVIASIPATPAGDRVRKGFQAIADHDWAVAQAWFEDALNHEPGDPGLQRLVDLATFTRQKGLAKPATPPARMSADEIAAMTAIIGNALEAAMNEDLDKSISDYLAQHPEAMVEPTVPAASPAAPPVATGPKPTDNQAMPLPPKDEPKFSWKALADALFKPLPRSKHPTISAVRG
jgi:tetratricopeptide (TPR) repeat protein